VSEITKAVRHLATASQKDAQPIHHPRLKLKTGAKHKTARIAPEQKTGWKKHD
jgi:hypothetical protein